MRFLLFCLFLSLFACQHREVYFKKLSPEQTGITFSNDLVVNDTFNAVTYEYVYNGGGVGAGDLNGDGLTDLYFSGNQVSSRLYLNKGRMQFEDITEQAGVGTNRWCTGVAVADVNNDGKQDIYVSVAGKVSEEERRNLLFINQGNDEKGVPQFVEQAAQYGLDDDGYSTQAAFFDYDLDGDLDLYLLTNALEKYDRNSLREKRTNGEAPSNDRLYRNNGDGTFSNVSREAGILIEGYGLGVTISDLNLDGYPDVYVANDFLSNDLLWINNGNGTFSNKAEEYTKHQTHNGMGTDVADFNNDLLPDIAVLDMLPEGNERKKMMLMKDNYDRYKLNTEYGYQPQYMRNTLQLHQGFLPDGSPRFSEIAFQSGLAATDWSWSVLFADFDQDGWKDAYITNGYRKDVTNLDYVNYSDLNYMFGTEESKQHRAFEEMEELPEVKIKNYLYHNNGDATFTNLVEDWGLGDASFSNGAVYADLDNDGDLDLITNNIDEAAFVYENKVFDKKKDHNRSLKIRLQENAPHLTSDNAKVLVFADGNTQYQEYSRYRGYKSTMPEELHFGVGKTEKIDSILVFWLDGKVSKVENIKPNESITIDYAAAKAYPKTFRQLLQPTQQPLFAEANAIQFQHKSNTYVDFKTTRTLPHMHSKSGPALAVGDVNGDGLDDVFIGGEMRQPATFLLQQADGSFVQQKFPQDSMSQDVGSLLFDADSDGDLDLYVVSGGSHAVKDSPLYQDRFYRNDGKGNFTKDAAAIPSETVSGSCVTAADFDRDGDLDLFVGGRLIPGEYPFPAKSFLLQNNNGSFTDVTAQLTPELENAGLVTSALWTDYDNDGWRDLILVGEWMPITIFKNQNGTSFVNQQSSIENSEGWWNSISSGDFDNDGYLDYVLGNWGLNSTHCAKPNEPVQVYAADYDNNGAIDPIFTCYIQGEQYAAHPRDMLIEQMPAMKGRFTDYNTYAKANFERTLSQSEYDNSFIQSAYEMRSMLLENVNGGAFELRPLPSAVQVAPLFGTLVEDVNGDGNLDILGVGNFYPSEQLLNGQYDASYGTVLLGNGDNTFKVINPLQAGFIVDGDARSLVQLTTNNGESLYLAGQNGGDLKTFQPFKATTAVPLAPMDAAGTATLKNGQQRRVEFYYGSGFLSQSSRQWIWPVGVQKVEVTDFSGKKRELRPGEQKLTYQK